MRATIAMLVLLVPSAVEAGTIVGFEGWVERTSTRARFDTPSGFSSRNLPILVDVEWDHSTNEVWINQWDVFDVERGVRLWGLLPAHYQLESAHGIYPDDPNNLAMDGMGLLFTDIFGNEMTGRIRLQDSFPRIKNVFRDAAFQIDLDDNPPMIQGVPIPSFPFIDEFRLDRTMSFGFGVPEPSTAFLAGGAVLAMLLRRNH